MSEKFTTRKFASAVIFKLNCSKILWSSFLVLIFLYIYRPIANPSSLYRPMFSWPNFFPRWFSMKRPTSSQTWLRHSFLMVGYMYITSNKL